MLNVLRSALIGACAMLSTYSPAFAYEGEIGAGHVWGNPTSAQAPPTDADPQAVFNQRYCTTANVLFGTTAASTWGCIVAGTGLTLSAGTLSITAPVTVALGGTNAITASGTSLDNITGFSSTGFVARIGAGSYSFNPTNTLPLNSLVNFNANTMLGNWTGSAAAPTANVLPSCADSAGAHLNYVSGTGVTCGNTSQGGAMTLLATLTASNSATLNDLTACSGSTCLTGPYTSYELVFENLLPATTSTTLELQVHSGGTFQSTSYLCATQFFNTTTSAISAPTTFVQLSGVTLVSNAGAGVSGNVHIFNPSQTASPKQIAGSLVNPATAGSISTVVAGGYWNGGNGAVDGFQVLFSTGNITSGTVKIYGIQ